MAPTMMSTSSVERVSHSAAVKGASQSSTDAAREFDDGFDFSADRTSRSRAVHLNLLCPTDHGPYDLGWLEADFVDIRVTARISSPSFPGAEAWLLGMTIQAI